MTKTYEELKQQAEKDLNQKTEEEFEEQEEETLPPKDFSYLSKEELLDILGLSIKSDEHNKLSTFLCMLSAFTENCQLNISFVAPSSTGKSYIPLELSKLFPDVIKLSYASPTSFFHDNTEKKDGEFVVDLERKILVFLDMPHYELLEKLRPLFSHDEKIILIKITDRSKRALRTKNIKIVGYPAVIFCSANLKLNEQENTRFLLLSPEVSQAKIKESIIQRIKKESNNLAYDVWLESDLRRQELRERIKYIKAEKIDEILIDDELKAEIEKTFLSRFIFYKPRHSRDISRLISLTKSFALLNLWQRRTDKQSTLKAVKEDFNNALWLWEKLSESQELNLPPYILELYKQVFLPLLETGLGVGRQEILRKHFEIYGRPLWDGQLRKEILPMLENAGLIFQEPDPNDRRKFNIKKQ